MVTIAIGHLMFSTIAELEGEEHPEEVCTRVIHTFQKHAAQLAAELETAKEELWIEWRKGDKNRETLTKAQLSEVAMKIAQVCELSG